MKKTLSLITVFLLCALNNSSAQNFFPLQAGNQYQIKYDWYWSGPGGTGESGTEFETISVINDSIINGETFYLLSGDPFPPGCLFSYDSLNQKLLVKIPGDDSVRLGVDFNAPGDSIYISYLTGEPAGYKSGGITPEVFWGDTLQTYEMTSTTGSYDIYNFTENVGFSYFGSFGGGGSLWYGDEYSTVSAIIDTNIFHQLILQIDSLYPVIDRPINTFPYLLSVPYHVSYSQLISAFYLTLEVVRDSSVIFNQNYYIPVSNPHLQINPPDLQVGDIIKLKAVISDNSIFNNIDLYPDTGWISFRVLDHVAIDDHNQLVYEYKLEQNYPNPFNPTTIINYEIPKRTFVSLKIYDILGNEVARLVNKEMSAGNYSVKFKAGNLSSGIYICRLRTPGFIKTTKMILAK